MGSWSSGAGATGAIPPAAPVWVWWFAERLAHPRIPMEVPRLVLWVSWVASLVTVKRMLPVLLLLATAVFGDGGGARCGRCVVPHA